MKTGQAQTMQSPNLHLRECVAAWIVAATLVLAMVASSLVALLFEGWA